MSTVIAQVEEEIEGEEEGAQQSEIVEIQPVRMYRSPEERREAGLGTELTDWLTFFGLAEIEKERAHDQFKLADGSGHLTTTEDQAFSKNLQLALEVEAFDWLEMEVIYEFEDQRHSRSQFDEAFAGIDLNGMGVKVGKQSLPFGEYYSHFAGGPMLEFGEIIKDSIIVDWSPSEAVEMSVYAFEGRVNQVGKKEQVDWGAALEWVSYNESVRVGLSYLSDLSETDEALLENEFVIARKVSAWSGYLLWGINERLETTLELVAALDEFVELERPVNRPSAYNWEIAWTFSPTLQLASRAEYSRELEDEVVWKYGLSLSWRPARQIGLSVDYLYGRYLNNFAFDDDDNVARRRSEFSALLSFEF